MDSDLRHLVQAREIMGPNRFLGVEALEECFSVKLTPKELNTIPPFPWSEADLTAPCSFLRGHKVHESHVALLTLAGVGGEVLTLDRIKAKDAWVELWWDEALNCTVASSRWHLMPLDPVAAFRSATYHEQLHLIPDEYEVPLLIDELLKHVLCPQPPIDPPSMWSEPAWQLRCADAGLMATHAILRVDLAAFDRERPWLNMGFEPDRAIMSDLGVAVSRRLQM